jgi:hypothetical protein
MATETEPTARDTLESLATRVRALEHGSVSKLGRAAIVIGVIGGVIGGVSTLRQLYIQFFTKAHFEARPANQLTLTWEPHSRILAVTRNIGIQNTGTQIGTIPDPPQVHLESTVMQNPTPFDVSAMDAIQAVPFPLEIKASDGKTLSFVMASTIPQTAEPAFPKEGTYKLTFSLNMPPDTVEQDVYCFQLNSDLLGQLANTGKVQFVAPDQPCP